MKNEKQIITGKIITHLYPFGHTIGYNSIIESIEIPPHRKKKECKPVNNKDTIE